jgi:hypothetical protein
MSIKVVAIEALRNCNAKQYPNLMDRLIRAGLCVPLFTEKQKLILLNAAVPRLYLACAMSQRNDSIRLHPFH